MLTGEWLRVLRSSDLPRSMYARSCHVQVDGRKLMITRSQTGKLFCQDFVDHEDNLRLSAEPQRGCEPLESWAVKEQDGFIKIMPRSSATRSEGRLFNPSLPAADVPPDQLHSVSASMMLARRLEADDDDFSVVASLGESEESMSKWLVPRKKTERASSAVSRLSSGTAESVERAPSDFSRSSSIAQPHERSTLQEPTKRKAVRPYTANAQPLSSSAPQLNTTTNKKKLRPVTASAQHSSSTAAQLHSSGAQRGGSHRQPLRPLTAAAPSKRDQALNRHIERIVEARQRPATAFAPSWQKTMKTNDENDGRSTSVRSAVRNEEELSEIGLGMEEGMRESITYHSERRDELVHRRENYEKLMERIQHQCKRITKAKELLEDRVKGLESDIATTKHERQPFLDRLAAIQKEMKHKESTSVLSQREELAEKSKVSTFNAKLKNIQKNLKVLETQLEEQVAQEAKEFERIDRLKLKIEADLQAANELSDVLLRAEEFRADPGSVDVNLEGFPADLKDRAEAMLKVRRSAKKRRVGVFEKVQTAEEVEAEEEAQMETELQAWRMRPAAWVRQRQRAMSATSPRWRKRLNDQAAEWEDLGKQARALISSKKKEEEEEPAQKKSKSPITAKYKNTVFGNRFEDSLFQRMKKDCKETWIQECSERILAQTTKDRDCRAEWVYRGVPANQETDYVRLNEITKDRMHPAPSEDMEAFRESMLGKWEDLEGLFKKIDKSGDGAIDVHEFVAACKMLKLPWTDFQAHRIFRIVAGPDMSLDFSEFVQAFAPPKASTSTQLLLQSSIPFLRDQSDEAVVDFVRRLVPVPKKKGDLIYKIGSVESWMWIVMSGEVTIRNMDGDLIKRVVRGQSFGELAVIHKEDVDGYIRREQAEATQDSLLYQMRRSEIEKVIFKHPKLRDSLHVVCPILEQEARAMARELGPKYPDCKAGGRTYHSMFDQPFAKIQPDGFIPELPPDKKLRMIKDPKTQWAGLELRSSLNEYGPDQKRQEEYPYEKQVVLRGVEFKALFDDVKTGPEKKLKIEEKIGSKYWRIKGLKALGQEKLLSLNIR